MNKERILIVEDETIIAMDVEDILRSEGYEITGVVATGADALEHFLKSRPDLMLVDIVLADNVDGIDVVRSIRKESDVPVIFMTAHADPNTFLRARETSPSGYLFKPVSQRDLLTSVDSALSRHRIEQRLKESEERFRIAASTLSDIIYEWDLKEKTIIWHGDIGSLLGFTDGAFPETLEAWAGRIHPEDVDGMAKAVDKGLKTGERQSVEFRLIRFDGTVKHAVGTGIVVRDRVNRKVKIIGAIADVTDHKKTEDAIRRKNEEIEAANRELMKAVADLEAMNDAYERINSELVRTQLDLIQANERLKSSEEIFSKAFYGSLIMMVLNRFHDGTYVEVNDTALKLTGYTRDEVIGKTPKELDIYEHPEDGRRAYRSLLDRGEVRDFVTSYKCKDGSVRKAIQNADVIHIDNEPHVITSFFDITDRRNAEEAIMRAEKLESVGLLAGGIAHDFNNILMGIMGNISMARMSGVTEKELRNVLESAEMSCLRAKDLTAQLLTFSKGGAPVRKSLSLEGTLENSVNFNLAGSNVKAEFMVPEGLWAVDADEGQLSQVINNLVINAVHAMPDGGVIEIGAENRIIGDNDGSPVTGERIRPGRYVIVSVLDHGNGIPPEIHRKIFEPYFTTKSGGSGLGLSVVYSIIKNHDGYVDFTSTPGEGTVFYIYLPASVEVPAAGGKGPSSDMEGRGRILVMDDERIVLDVVKRMLEHLGYEVSAVRDGKEAVEHYGKGMSEGRPYSAVIMDLVIPGGMGGREAIRHLLDLDPGVRAVVSSGYSSDSVLADHERYGFKGFIQKPFRLEDLGTLLNRVLGR